MYFWHIFVIFCGESLIQDCVKSVLIHSYSGLYFLAFGLNTQRNELSLRIKVNASKFGPVQLRMRTLFTQGKVFRHFDLFHEVMKLQMFQFDISDVVTTKVENILPCFSSHFLLLLLLLMLLLILWRKNRKQIFYGVFWPFFTNSWSFEWLNPAST